MGALSPAEEIARESDKVRKELFPQLMAQHLILREELHDIALGLGVERGILDTGDPVEMVRAIKRKAFPGDYIS